MTETPAADDTARGVAPFSRVVCGIDGSPEALEAARQARRLAPGVPTVLVSAVDTLQEPARPFEIPALAHLMRKGAAEALGAAVGHLESPAVVGASDLTTAIEEGHVADVIRFVVGDDPTALVAVGAHVEQRPPGEGPPSSASYRERTAIEVVRRAPCSVLVGRRPSSEQPFPRAIAVGVDGSEASATASAVAVRIATETGAPLSYVVAVGGKGADLAAIARTVPGAPLGAVDRRHPVDALLAAAEQADLVVVGHRGLHGLRALGSVSERVLTRCDRSVLVVRRR